MILKLYIDNWRQYAPWPSSTMVEQDQNFGNDTAGLLPVDYGWDFDAACQLVWNKVAPLMKGESWKNSNE